MITTLKVAGLDPAFANFGMVLADLVVQGNGDYQLYPTAMQVIRTKKDNTKQVRSSSDALARAQELHSGLHEFLQQNNKPGPHLVFAEVPSGAQDARAARGLGIAVGILASCSTPILEVSPAEIKKLFTKERRPVEKVEVMQWAYSTWPDAPWLMHGGKRTGVNEHLADALASIVAGLRTPQFQQLAKLHFGRSINEAPSTDNHRLAPDRSPRRRVPLGPVSVDKRADSKARNRVRTHPR